MSKESSSESAIRHLPGRLTTLEPKRSRPEVTFAIGFVLSAGVLSFFYTFPYDPAGTVSGFFGSYLNAYARAGGAVIALFDPKVHVHGDQILGQTPLRIVRDCDAAEMKIVLASAILAFPAPWGRRLFGVLLGVLVLFVANLGRITSLYFIKIHAPGSFELAHRELFPLGMFLIAGAAFFAWVRFGTARHSKPSTGADAPG